MVIQLVDSGIGVYKLRGNELVIIRFRDCGLDTELIIMSRVSG
jgi:hypothetical protein